MTANYQKIIEAARAGGQIVKQYFNHPLEFKEKSGIRDFVTKADLESEAAILKILQANFPDYNIYSEEIGEINKNSEYTFIIDPLDATSNFYLGIPNFSVLIALLKNDDILFAVTYQPILDQVYYAEKGQGAFLNDQKIKVSQETDLQRATVSYFSDYNHDKGYRVGLIKKFEDANIKRWLVFWSIGVDFCLLASGKIEAIVSARGNLYDFIAGKFIAKEAGAVITDLQGQPEKNIKNNNFLISCNQELHNKLLPLVKL